MKVTVAYSPKYLDWNLGDGHPTNPIRAKLALELLNRVPGLDVETIDPDGMYGEDNLHYFNLAREIHHSAYVTRVAAGECGEWRGKQPILGMTAGLMFGGTVALTERLLRAQERGVYFNPQGAKHHAHYDHSSGFCVFNDMAWAATRLADEGKRVVYLDWDAHHGDGVEEMLRDREDILTISVHDGTVFPGTGHEDGPGYHNYPAYDSQGDEWLRETVDSIRDTLMSAAPDVILLACGADGLAGDPLASLQYSQEGLDHAARMVGSVARRLNADVLIGGAGGYQPYDEVPEHWSRCVSTIAKWSNIW